MLCIVTAAFRPHTSFRHEALLWADDDALIAGVLPFVREGVDAGQPVLVGLLPRHAAVVREALGVAPSALFLDPIVASINPTTGVDIVRRFLDDQPEGGPVRMVSEPVWPGRPPAEVAECQLAEALLNITIDPDRPAWILCCYGLGLGADVLVEAHRSHPVLLEDGRYRGSLSYAGRGAADDLFASPLPSAPPEAVDLLVDDEAATVTELAARAREAGVPAEGLSRLAEAVRLLAAGGLGRWMRVWVEADALVCELTDQRRIDDPSSGHRAREAPGSRGHALAGAHALADLMQVRSDQGGTVVRLRARRG